MPGHQMHGVGMDVEEADVRETLTAALNNMAKFGRILLCDSRANQPESGGRCGRDFVKATFPLISQALAFSLATRSSEGRDFSPE